MGVFQCGDSQINMLCLQCHVVFVWMSQSSVCNWSLLVCPISHSAFITCKDCLYLASGSHQVMPPGSTSHLASWKPSTLPSSSPSCITHFQQPSPSPFCLTFLSISSLHLDSCPQRPAPAQKSKICPSPLNLWPWCSHVGHITMIHSVLVTMPSQAGPTSLVFHHSFFLSSCLHPHCLILFMLPFIHTPTAIPCVIGTAPATPTVTHPLYERLCTNHLPILTALTSSPFDFDWWI